MRSRGPRGHGLGRRAQRCQAWAPDQFGPTLDASLSSADDERPARDDLVTTLRGNLRP